MSQPMPESALQPHTVYRSRSTSVALVGFGMMFGAVMVLFLILTWGDPGELVICGLGLCFAAWVGIRVSRCGVFVEDDGVRVLNPFSTVHLKWSEIARFELSSYGACLIKLVHGRSVGIVGIQQTARDARKAKKDTDEARMISELNALLESHRAG
jgi:hypothetical protein